MDRREQARMLVRIKELTADHPDLHGRLKAVLRYGATIRSTEYHLTNACNIRCEGCWFFAYGHDQNTRDVKDPDKIRAFVEREKERGINTALLIGGEPTLFPERIRIFQDVMERVTVSTNGLKKLPYEGFEDVAIGISLFGGGSLDDELRAILPSGKRFNGLFDKSLENYENDPRVGFIYAVTEDGIEHIEPTVKRIRENGNRLTFNFYSKYNEPSPLAQSHQRELLEEVLRVQADYSDVVMSHPYYIRALITGASHFGEFGYDVCPSISVDNPKNAERMQNGNPYLPLFNAVTADLETHELCCTSGHCDGCRDSQAVQSWLLVSLHKFTDSLDHLRTWVELSESYWDQFVWSPYRGATGREKEAAA